MHDRTAVLRLTATGALALVQCHRDALDVLNIFPVPDSDTGTNICLTFTAATAGVDALGPDATAQETAGAIARGALLGARGNSGVILGQYLGELAVRLAGTPRGPHVAAVPHVADAPTAAEVAEALTAAAAAARRAVARPVEGTVLTVADDAARAARDAAGPVPARPGQTGTSAAVTARAAVTEARRAVGRTTAQLDVLTAAGVEDAGGWGLVLLLEALLAALAGPRDVVGPPARGAVKCDHDAHAHDGPLDGEFELMAVAHTDDDAVVEDLRATLVRLGESVAVLGHAGLWQVHVHSDHAAEVLTALLDPRLGVRQVVVRHLVLAGGGRPAGVVVVTAVPGLVADLARSSAVVLLADGEVAEEALTRAVEDTGCDDVLVLVQSTAADRGGEQPSSGPQEGLRLPPGTRVRMRRGLDAGHLVAAAAGLLLAPAEAGADEVVAAVERAVGTVRTATITPGVGAGGHDVVMDVARGLIRSPDDGAPAEVLTAVTSAATPAEVVTALQEGLGGTVELVVVDGGLPGTDVVLAAEGSA